MKRSIYTGLLAASLFAGPGFAESVGEIATASGDQGAVVIVRAGKSVEVSAGAALEAADRVVVRGNGEATINAFACTRTLEAPAMVVLDPAFCDAPIVELLKDGRQVETASRAPATGDAGIGLGGPVATGAGVASLAAIVGDSSDDTSAAVAAGTGQSDGGSAGDDVFGIGTPAPVTDTPPRAFFDDSAGAGSGLDTGLFGFFEATSS